MKNLLKKIWDKGYLYHYVPIFPSDRWWNLWHFPFSVLCILLICLIPTPAWVTPAIASGIVNMIGIVIIGVFLIAVIMFAYLMLTDPVTNGKLFPRTRRKQDND